MLAEVPPGAPQVRVIPHFHPLYTIEGDPARLPEGIYDRMSAVGAHEIIIESPEHNHVPRPHERTRRSSASSRPIPCPHCRSKARLALQIRYRLPGNNGQLAGAEWPHAHSQVLATMFVPRRVLYELRAARLWYADKERCVFCDILHQETRQAKRVVDSQGDYVALCPFRLARAHFELCLMSRRHNHLFEQPLPGAHRRQLAALLGRTLRRLRQITDSYHLVLHTAPNTAAPAKARSPSPYWQTLAEDFHWHIEILPILQDRSKSYSIKEIYFNALLPEQAAEQLRQRDPNL